MIALYQCSFLDFGTLGLPSGYSPCFQEIHTEVFRGHEACFLLPTQTDGWTDGQVDGEMDGGNGWTDKCMGDKEMNG